MEQVRLESGPIMLAAKLTLATMLMAKHKPQNETLGARLRRLRQERAFSLRELAEVVGISYRMIHYYETEESSCSAEILIKFARAFDVSADELLGLERSKKTNKRKKTPDNIRLLRRLRQVENLPAKERRSVLQFIDALVERQSLKEARE